MKCLVAIDPFTRVFTFVSPGFSGNSIDGFVVESNSCLDLLQPGQQILPDRGFTARGLITEGLSHYTFIFTRTSQLTSQQAIDVLIM